MKQTKLLLSLALNIPVCIFLCVFTTDITGVGIALNSPKFMHYMYIVVHVYIDVYNCTSIKLFLIEVYVGEKITFNISVNPSAYKMIFPLFLIFHITKSHWTVLMVKLSSQILCTLEAIVVKKKMGLYITTSGECDCLVNLIKQQVQKSGHMVLMCPQWGWQEDKDSNMRKFAYICIGSQRAPELSPTFLFYF